MAATLEEVTEALHAEEPDYREAARSFGPGALPHLQRLVVGGDPMLASKAAYLAGVIGTAQGVEVLKQAARNDDPRVRAAAAAGARGLSSEARSDVLLNLIDDTDFGVQKVALKAVPANASPALKARIESLSTGAAAGAIRNLSREVLARQAVGSIDVQGTKQTPTRQ